MIIILGDLHLGLKEDQQKYLKLKTLLEQFPNPEAIVLLGDIFDFYFECTKQVKKLYGPFIDLISSRAAEIPVYYIMGNHDFFPLTILQKAGVRIKTRDLRISLGTKSVYFTHGDLLTPGGIITRVFLSFKLWYLLMKLIPCGIVYSIAGRISQWSRKNSASRPLKESVLTRVERLLFRSDVVITAHFHLPIIKLYEGGKVYANPGDWLEFNTFMTLDESLLTLWRFDNSLIVKEKEVKI